MQAGCDEPGFESEAGRRCVWERAWQRARIPIALCPSTTAGEKDLLKAAGTDLSTILSQDKDAPHDGRWERIPPAG